MLPYRNSFVSHISAIEWSKLNVLIKACCNGTIELIDCEPWGKSKSLRVYRQIELKHNDYITDLKLSCNELYLLISTAKGRIYIGYLNKHDELLSLKEIQMIFKSSLSNILVIKIMISKKKQNKNLYYFQSASWHPWSESLLAIGETNNRITIFNVKSLKILASNVVEPFFKKSEHCVLDFLTFNPSSAELVVFQRNSKFSESIAICCRSVSITKILKIKVVAIS